MKSYPSKFKEFSAKNCPNGRLAKQKLQNSIYINPYNFSGVSTQSKQTLYFRWHLKSYHFAIFLLQILLFVVKTLKYLVDLSFEHLSFSKKRKLKQLYSFPVLSRFCIGLLGTPVPKSLVFWVSPVGILKTLKAFNTADWGKWNHKKFSSKAGYLLTELCLNKLKL